MCRSFLWVSLNGRLKENVNPLKYGLDELLKIQPVSYDWKLDNRGSDIGVIAQDLLEIIEEADLLYRRKSAGGFENVDIVGTLPGFDKDTQYQTIVEDNGKIWFYREVTGIISIRLAQDANARINTITDEKESIITVGDGESISIIIRQTN